MKKIIVAFLIGFSLASIPTALGAIKQFYDVSGNEWFAEHVNKLSDLGIVSGYPDGTFRPGDNITRAEEATIASRLLEYSQYNFDQFPVDTSTTPGATLYYVCKSVENDSRIYKTTTPNPPFEGESYDYKGNALATSTETKDCQRTTKEYFDSKVSAQ